MMFAETTSGGTGATGTSNRSTASIHGGEARIDPPPASWHDVTLDDVRASPP
jgi:hypothetical protein